MKEKRRVILRQCGPNKQHWVCSITKCIQAMKTKRMEEKQINRVIQIKTTTAKFIPEADRETDRQGE